MGTNGTAGGAWGGLEMVSGGGGGMNNNNPGPKVTYFVMNNWCMVWGRILWVDLHHYLSTVRSGLENHPDSPISGVG